MNASSKALTPSDDIGIKSELGAHNYNPLDVVLARGEGVWVQALIDQ